MARTSLAVQEQFSKLSGQKLSVGKISVPNTAIINRAQINDFANDMGVRFGVERIPTQRSYQLSNEFGATGQPVWGIVGDTFDQIRVVGTGGSTVVSSGQYISLKNNDYIEITFYGTGLNLLYNPDNAGRDLKKSVDGGSESDVDEMSNILLKNRGYSVNQIISLFSGLTLGIHTAKIRNNSGNDDFIYGFEIVNQSSTLDIRPGSILKDGRKFNIASGDSESLNSGFESGTLGTRGGRVLVYAKANGTIAKAVMPTNSAQANLTSADHTNEEIIRQYFFSEFGANRADDFSTLTTSRASAFTLDDGVTTLISNAADANQTLLNFSSNGCFVVLTFIGTGLDIIQQDSGNGGADNYTFSVDGATAVSMSGVGSTTSRTVKIVSGLPYGAHTIRFTRVSAATWGMGINSFIVYGPKKPALPVGAAEVSEYYLMADYVIKTNNGLDFMSTGIIRKMNTREITYVGTWSGPTINVAGISDAGWYILSATAASYAQYTFYGTGFEYRTHFTSAQTFNQTVTVNGSSNLSAFTTSILTASAVTFTAATGVIAGTGGGHNGLMRVSGLPLGLHTVRITQNNSASNMYIDILDIITPVHMPKKNLFAIQNASTIGSCAIADLREPSDPSQKVSKNYLALGLTSAPTTTATTPVSCPDMIVMVDSEGDWYDIDFEVVIRQSIIGNQSAFVIYVDGVQVGAGVQNNASTANYDIALSHSVPVYLSAGTHRVQILWSTSAGTLTARGPIRQLSVKMRR